MQTSSQNLQFDMKAIYLQVNDLQAKIKEVTRKMMAIVSELCMHQANALRLQHEVSHSFISDFCLAEHYKEYLQMKSMNTSIFILVPSIQCEKYWFITDFFSW